MEEGDKELLGMLIVLTLLMSGIQWFFVRFTHWSVALILTALITLIVTFFYVTLSHATPNGGSNGPGVDAFITPLLTLSVIFLCTLWLVCYLSGKHIPNMVIIVSLSIFVFSGIGRYVYQYVDAVTVYSRLFSSCRLEIVNETVNAPILENIGFKSTSGSFVHYLDPDPTERSVFIPTNTDKIIFRYNSGKSENIQEEVFPFDYTLCQEKEYRSFGLVFWVQQKRILPMKLLLRSDNKIDLYINNRFIQQYQLRFPAHTSNQ